MKSFFKKILIFIFFIIISYIFLFKTSMGIDVISKSLSYLLSNKTNKIKITSLNIDDYPKITIQMNINRDAKMDIYGVFDISNLDMKYHIFGDKFRYKSINTQDSIDIEGKILGFCLEPKVVGSGDMFGGDISFSFVKIYKEFKEVNVELHNANSRKLLTFFKKRGSVAGEVDVNITNGYYSSIQHVGRAEYNLIYSKIFKSSGDIEYHKRDLIVKGKSDSFGGLIKYIYANHKLKIDLEGIYLLKIVEHTHYKSPISSRLYGYIDFDVNQNIGTFDINLKDTRFIKTSMSDKIFNLTGFDILKDTYNNSSFIGGYRDSILYAMLKIDNKREHIYLNDIKIDIRKESINSTIELEVGGKRFYGDIDGRLREPHISIDIKKILKYQLNKELNSIIKVDRVKEKAKSFFNSFFKN